MALSTAHIRPYRGRIAFYVLLAILSVLFTMATALSVADFLRLLFGTAPLEAPAAGNLISQALQSLYLLFISKGADTALLLFSLLLLALYGFKNLFSYLAAVQAQLLRVKIVRDIRDRMFANMLRKPMAWFAARSEGDTMARFGSDVVEYDESVLASLQSLCVAAISIVLYSAMLVYISPKLTLAAVAMFPVVAFAISGLSRKLRRKSDQVQRLTARLLSFTGQAMDGARIIKSHTAIDFVRRRFSAVNADCTRQRTRMFRRIYSASPVSDFLGNCVVVAVMLAGAMLVARHDAGLTSELFVSYVMMFVLMIPPAKDISTAWSQLRKGQASAERIAVFFDNTGTEDKPPETIPAQSEKYNTAQYPKAAPGEPFKIVAVSNLSFHYQTLPVGSNHSQHPAPNMVLRDISFELRPGRMTALVGESGSGKSTIVDLLLRFYEPSSGSIKVDGRDLRSVEGWLGQVAVVRQQQQLFSGTVLENILFGSSQATRRQAEEAARMASATEFIERLQGDYNHAVGEGGCNLSGGQRQRLCIARALAREPRLLILDEATSALDAEAEATIKHSIRRLLSSERPPAVLVVAHRLSTVTDADEILTLDGGAIVERGTHADLMRRGGRYATLARLQHLALMPLAVLMFAAGMLFPQKAAADTIPLSLTATALSPRSVALSWQPSAQHCGSYNVYRQYPGAQNMTMVATTNLTSWRDTLRRAVCSDTVHYMVECQTDSQYYRSAVASVFIDDNLPTSPCIIHTVSVDSASQRILLTWRPSPDRDVMGYFICSGSPCMGLDTVWHRTDTTYLVPGLPATERRIFRIYAFDSCLKASVLTEPAGNMVLRGATTHCGTRCTLYWDAYQAMPDTLEGYEVQMSGSDGTFSAAAFGSEPHYEGPLPGYDSIVSLRVAACGRGRKIKAYSNTVRLHFTPVDTAAAPHIFKVGREYRVKGVTLSCLVDTSYHARPYVLWRRAAGGQWEQKMFFSPAVPLVRLCDTTAADGMQYLYRLSISDPCDLSLQFSNTVATMPLTLAGSSLTECRLAWRPPQPQPEEAAPQWPSAGPCWLMRRQVDAPYWQLVAITTDSAYVDNFSGAGLPAAPLLYQVMTTSDTPAVGTLFDTLLSDVAVYSREPTVYFPNAFTPGIAAGGNSLFCVSHTFLAPENYQLSVFSRNGMQVFSTKDPSQCWDGTNPSGKPLPAGVYVYLMTYSQHGEDTRVQRGTVLLIR